MTASADLTLQWHGATSASIESKRQSTGIAAFAIGLFAASTVGLTSTTSVPVVRAQIYLPSAATSAPIPTGPVRLGEDLATQAARDLPAIVTWLHEQSGLTWDQLGRALGVSRRAIHLWARGGRMNSTNAENLNSLVGIVRELPGTSPAANRAALLASRTGGRSLFDDFRARADQDRVPVTDIPFSADQLLGAFHDEVPPQR